MVDNANSRIEPRSLLPAGTVPDDDGIIAYDSLSDRYFTVRDVSDIRRAVVNANESMYGSSDGKVTLNHVYYELGLREVHFGDMIGWVQTNSPVHVALTSRIVSYGGKERPVVILHWNIDPELLSKEEWS
jgi:hypothetical protein